MRIQPIFLSLGKTLADSNNYLYDNNRLLVSKNYANQSLTEKNIGIENYRIIVEHLRNN